MDNKRNEIYLGALLHDIGKFVFRSQDLKAGNGHELLGEQFIREYFGKIEILSKQIESFIKYSKHHSVFNYCRIAEYLASAERDEQDNNEVRRPIISVLSNVQFSAAKVKPQGIFYYNPEKSDFKNIFPIELKNEKSENWKSDDTNSILLHKELLKDFKIEIKALSKIKSIESLSTTIFYLLQKYTSRISSAGYGSKPDISLFDHLRAVAGLTNCLTAQYPENEINNYKPENVNTEFYYLKGDITGIQKFIYSDINLDQAQGSKGLAKKLRGRSFYISLLTDFIAQQFLETFELAEANLLYAGGGHFNLVISYNKYAEKKIDSLVEDINLMLLEKIGSRLCLVVAKTKCDKDLYSNTSKYITEVNFELEKAKQKKHFHYLEKVIFQTNQINKPDFNDDTRLGKNLPYSDYLIEIKAKENSDFKDDKNLVASFEKYNIYHFTVSNAEQKYTNEYQEIYDFFKQRKDAILSAKVINIESTDFLAFAEYLNNDFTFPISYAYKFIAKEAAQKELVQGNQKFQDILDFEELAEIDYSNDNEKLSYPQLAVIRLDVDNLGAVFGLGLGDTATFSRIATMSRELDLFFSGYMNVLAEKYKLYTTYSGGDDAFLIGSWYNILHFAKELYQSFKKFTCNNPNFSFSAGIFICDPHLPIAKMAEKTAELEDLSKHFVNKEGIKKNAVTVFDVTLNWDEYINMLDFGNLILNYVKSEEENTGDEKLKLARSIIHRVLRIIKSCFYEKDIYENKILKSKQGALNVDNFYRNISHLHYLFARQGYNKKKITDAENNIAKEKSDELTNEISNHVVKQFISGLSKEELIKNYLIPTNYVVLKTRKLTN